MHMLAMLNIYFSHQTCTFPVFNIHTGKRLVTSKQNLQACSEVVVSTLNKAWLRLGDMLVTYMYVNSI